MRHILSYKLVAGCVDQRLARLKAALLLKLSKLPAFQHEAPLKQQLCQHIVGLSRTFSDLLSLVEKATFLVESNGSEIYGCPMPQLRSRCQQLDDLVKIATVLVCEHQSHLDEIKSRFEIGLSLIFFKASLAPYMSTNPKLAHLIAVVNQAIADVKSTAFQATNPACLAQFDTWVCQLEEQTTAYFREGDLKGDSAVMDDDRKRLRLSDPVQMSLGIMQFERHPVSADGNCLFEAIQQVVRLTKKVTSDWSLDFDLRHKVAETIWTHSMLNQDFLLASPEYMLRGIHPSFLYWVKMVGLMKSQGHLPAGLVSRLLNVSYVWLMAQEGVFGGATELQALARVLPTPIFVIDQSNPEDGPQLSSAFNVIEATEFGSTIEVVSTQHEISEPEREKASRQIFEKLVGAGILKMTAYRKPGTNRFPPYPRVYAQLIRRPEQRELADLLSEIQVSQGVISADRVRSRLEEVTLHRPGLAPIWLFLHQEGSHYSSLVPSLSARTEFVLMIIDLKLPEDQRVLHTDFVGYLTENMADWLDEDGRPVDYAACHTITEAIVDKSLVLLAEVGASIGSKIWDALDQVFMAWDIGLTFDVRAQLRVELEEDFEDVAHYQGECPALMDFIKIRTQFMGWIQEGDKDEQGDLPLMVLRYYATYLVCYGRVVQYAERTDKQDLLETLRFDRQDTSTMALDWYGELSSDEGIT